MISAPWPWIFSNRSRFGSLSELIEWRLSPQSLRPEHLRAQQHPPGGHTPTVPCGVLCKKPGACALRQDYLVSPADCPSQSLGSEDSVAGTSEVSCQELSFVSMLFLSYAIKNAGCISGIAHVWHERHTAGVSHEWLAPASARTGDGGLSHASRQVLLPFAL